MTCSAASGRMPSDARRSASDHPPGFTLVETLLALALAAVVLGAAERAVVRAAAARTAVSAATAATARAQRVLREIARELEGTGPATVRVSAPPGRPALAWTVWEGDPRTLSWTLDDGVLVRRRRSPLLADSVPAGSPQPLVAGVTAFAVRAWDGSRWVPSWEGARPPHALALTLALEGTDPLEARVRLPVAEALD